MEHGFRPRDRDQTAESMEGSFLGFGPLWKGVGLQRERGVSGYAVNSWSIKRPPNGTKLDRRSTGAIPRPLGKPRSIPRKFNTHSQRETKGDRRRAWERRIAKRTTGKRLRCMRRTRMQNEMHMMT